MFALGHIHFKEYTLWVTVPPFSLEPYQQGADQLSYYDVLLSKKEVPNEDPNNDQYIIPIHLLYNFYVDIVSHPIFKSIMKLNDRNQPIEDQTDMIQYQSYLDRKGSSQPLYKLSKKSVEELLAILRATEQ